MTMYLVGGAVRDRLMGIPAKDEDYVVVGSTVEEMLNLGFKQVGKDFPIFVCIDGGSVEYALARRSRQGGVADFGPEVTLEEDLGKRDLTINAMAQAEDGAIIDPYGGQEDLRNKVLRMVNMASLTEDPIRVLRIARFAARYPDFRIDRDTFMTMFTMAMLDQLNNLTPERVWKEISRGLMEKAPQRMLQVLRECRALKAILPELNELYGIPQPEAHHPEICTGIHIEQVLEYAASQNYSAEIRFAAMLHDLGKAVTPKAEWPAHHAHEKLGVKRVKVVCARLRVPVNFERMAIAACQYHGVIHSAMNLTVAALVKYVKKFDGFRNPDRLLDLLRVAECDARGRWSDTVSMRHIDYPQADRFSNAMVVATNVETAEIAARFKGRELLIADTIHAARVSAVKQFENQQKKQ